MNLEWSIITRVWPLLMESTRTTLSLTILALLFGTMLGLPLALMRMSRFRIPRVLAISYVGFFRSIPLLFLLFFAFFGLPILGIDLDPYLAAVVAISLDTAYYKAEVIRGGILSVPTGQYEASEALGLRRNVYFRRIIFAQGIRIMVPNYFNSAMLVLKATSLAGAITVTELTGTASQLISTTFRPLEILAAISLIYLFLTGILAGLQVVFERKYALRM